VLGCRAFATPEHREDLMTSKCATLLAAAVVLGTLLGSTADATA
jgi:hypothetical protein